MECQYYGCTNIGVHSCSNCGKLVCGKHAEVLTGYTVSIKCKACLQVERHTRAVEEAERKQEESTGCTISSIGLGILVLGVVVAVVTPVTWLGIIIAVVGFLAGCFGLAFFL